eukprot:4102754-Amphidinium_carterae.1
MKPGFTASSVPFTVWTLPSLSTSTRAGATTLNFRATDLALSLSDHGTAFHGILLKWSSNCFCSASSDMNTMSNDLLCSSLDVEFESADKSHSKPVHQTTTNPKARSRAQCTILQYQQSVTRYSMLFPSKPCGHDAENCSFNLTLKRCKLRGEANI